MENNIIALFRLGNVVLDKRLGRRLRSFLVGVLSWDIPAEALGKERKWLLLTVVNVSRFWDEHTQRAIKFML